ncbi:MAG: endonuclease/exonuclease/phosphatase family protein, partial [Planctomycetota bacterium]
MSKLSVAVSSLCALLGLFACASTPAGAGGAGGPAPQEDASLVFAFWNVENLFDAVDDPANPGDDEYLPD